MSCKNVRSLMDAPGKIPEFTFGKYVTSLSRYFCYFISLYIQYPKEGIFLQMQCFAISPLS